MQTSDYTLAKNRSGKWEARYNEKLPDGRWRSRTFSTRCEDRALAEHTAEAFFRGVSVVAAAAAAPTVEEICDAYLKATSVRGLDKSQEVNLVWVRRALGAHTMPELTTENVSAYVESRKTKGQVQNSTVRRELGALTAALNWAGKSKFRGITPGEVPFVEKPQESRAKQSFLDEKQEQKFWDLALSDSDGKPRLSRVSRFVAIALDTAARTEAIEGLTWDRVDLVRGVIDFRDPARRETRKRRAVVPIATRLRPILERAYLERVDDFVAGKGAIKKAWERWLPAEFAWVTKHDLRRTWATLAARGGVPLWDIAGVLADDLATVTKHYAVHQPGHLQAAVDWRAKQAG